MEKEILEERERIKEIIKKEFESEITMKRMKQVDRLEHIQSQIFWKIDNPRQESLSTS